MFKDYSVRYFSSEPPCAIVAVINYTDEERTEIFDWGAYIGGGCTDEHRESSTALGRWVAQHGVKMHSDEAAPFFSNLPLNRYRR